MKIKYKFPALIFYTDKVEKGKGYVVRGKTVGPIVIIGKLYDYDKGLLAHEITHTEQFWLHGLLIHMLLYKFNRRYRLKCECECYYAQWRAGEPKDHTQAKKDDFTDRIWLFYNLKYSREYVDKVFSDYFDKWDIISRETIF
jgi:hypothetical protein